MVCNRCVLAIRDVLHQLGIAYSSIQLGEIQMERAPESPQLLSLKNKLEDLGFELLDDRKSKLIEKIKTLVLELVHFSPDQPRENLSDYLAKKLNYDYNYLSNVFSETEGITIEKYYIAQRIEKVKELLVYGELTLSEIAWQLGYSSVAYLSNQFKKVTGLSPSHFKKLGIEKRKPLDNL